MMTVVVSFGSVMQGRTFHVRPRSRAHAFGPSHFWPILTTSGCGVALTSAMPPRPFAPYTFSAVIERVRALDSFMMFPRPAAAPLNATLPS